MPPLLPLRVTIRRTAGLYLAAFFLGVAAAPHRHLNGLEDLLFDQRSDSGVLVLADGTETVGGPAFDAARSHRDVPCLACFSGDFVAAPGPAVGFVAILTPLPNSGAPPEAAGPDPHLGETSSRAPPRIS
jgi:hypothetical protein